MAILRVPERRAGTIPQYNRQMVYNTTPGADASARLSDAAGAIAAQGARESWQPVIATGKAVQQAAKVGLDLYTEYNKTKAFEAYNKFQESMTADLYGENGVFNRRGENAQNSVADTEELVRTRAEEFAANLSDMGKNFFRQQVGQYNRQLLPQVQRHETHEFNAWQVGTQKTRAELALNDALENYNNSDVFDQRLQESNLALMEIGRINGLSREQTELAVRQNTSAAQLSRANAFLSQDNIAGAKAVLATGLMEGKDKITLEAKIRNAQKALEAEARQRQLEARVALSGRIADAEAAWKDGLEVDNPPAYNEIAAAYGENADKVWKQLRGLERLSTDIRAVRNMSPAEQDALLAERKPEPGEGYAENRQIYSLLVQSIAQDRKQRQDDPSAYVAQVVPDVSAARQAMYEEMTPETVGAYVTARNAALEARGISTTDVPLLPERDAQQMAVRLQNSADPVAEIQQLSSVTGKYYQQLVKQLSTNEKLSDSFVLVAGGMSPDAGKKLIDASRDKDFPKKAENLLNLTGTAKTDFTNKVQERIEDFNRTFLAGANSKYPEMIKEGVTRLALQYKMLTGDSDDTCIEKAARKVVLDRYSIVGPHGREFRVPVRFDADAIERGSAFELSQIFLKPAELMEPLHAPWMGTAQSKNLYASEIRRQAQWVTNEDETGVILCVLGRPVRDKDGNLVTRTWEELFASGLENATQGDVIGSLGGGGY